MSSFTRGVPNVDDLLTSTLDNYREKLTEQWLGGFAITKKMLDGGNVDEIDGGNDIIEHIEYQDNDTADWIGVNGSVSVAMNQILTDARFGWTMLAGSVGITDREEAQNKGKPAFFDLLEARVNNLKNTFRQKFEAAAGASSTANANTMWALADIIDASNPSLGNFGDIDRSSYSWWGATETASGSMATQGLEDIRTAYHTVSRSGSDPVNMMLTTLALYTAYQARLTPFERLAPTDKGDLEFTSLAFMGKPVFYSDQLASGLWLGINTKYLRLKILKGAKFVNKPFVREPGGIKKTSVVELMLQMTCTRPASQFKLTGMTA
jgi:hypothetical protein